MKVSVIVLNYNTKNLLEKCLHSLIDKTKDIQYEIIVVDNNSTDGSSDFIKQKFSDVKLLKSQQNLGFAGGNNLGIREVTGDYVLLLNSDTLFIENTITEMAKFMEDNPKAGISSCQLIDQKKQIQPSGGFFPNLLRIFTWMFFLDDLPFVDKLIKPFHPHGPEFYTSNQWYKDKHLQDWVTGAFFLIRKKVIDQIGLLDENFFMYAEEMEYCYRAYKANWQIYYLPESKIIHLGGKSGTSKGAIIGEFQGLKYFFAKHKPKWQSFVLLVMLKSGSALRMLLFGIIKPKSGLKEIYAEALGKI